MVKQPRRGSGPLSWIVGVILLGSAGAGGWFVSQQVGDPFRTVQSLIVPDYLANANGLRGNTYKVRGEVDNQLSWKPDGTRLLSVRVDDEVLPLLLPAGLRETVIQKGQIFFFHVEVVDGGVLNVIALSKA